MWWNISRLSVSLFFSLFRSEDQLSPLNWPDWLASMNSLVPTTSAVSSPVSSLDSPLSVISSSTGSPGVPFTPSVGYGPISNPQVGYSHLLRNEFVSFSGLIVSLVHTGVTGDKLTLSLNMPHNVYPPMLSFYFIFLRSTIFRLIPQCLSCILSAALMMWSHPLFWSLQEALGQCCPKKDSVPSAGIAPPVSTWEGHFFSFSSSKVFFFF